MNTENDNTKNGKLPKSNVIIGSFILLLLNLGGIIAWIYITLVWAIFTEIRIFGEKQTNHT